MIVTSNKPFSAWGEIFDDEVTAVAMIDRLVHHAEILSLKGDSDRLRDKDLGARPGGRCRPLSGSRARPLRLAYGSAPRAGAQPKVGALSTGTDRCVFNRT